MFSSALAARRLSAPASRLSTCVARAHPASGIPTARVQLRHFTQPTAPARDPVRASLPARDDLLHRVKSSDGDWATFMDTISKSQDPTKKLATRAAPKRTAEAEGKADASVFDAIRAAMPKKQPSGGVDPTTIDWDEEWRMRSQRMLPELRAEPIQNAYSGRSFMVKEGDVNESYKQLQRRLKGNNVRKELLQTVRHEKKGVKRRRLTSERWRRRFAEEVRKKVQLVQEIQARRA